MGAGEFLLSIPVFLPLLECPNQVITDEGWDLNRKDLTNIFFTVCLDPVHYAVFALFLNHKDLLQYNPRSEAKE